MEEVRDTIPARTAVILHGAADSYTFKYSASSLSQLENLLNGTLWKETIAMKDDNYYILAKPEDKEVGMYKPLYDEENDNNAFTNQANKAYLHLEQSALQPASFSFRGMNNFGPTTEVDEIKTEEGNIENVYDLMGRKVENPTRGIYVIDGKKILVK